MKIASVLSRLCVIALAATMGVSTAGCQDKKKSSSDTEKEDKLKGDDDDDDDDGKKKKKADDDDDDDDDDDKKKKADDDDDDDDDDDKKKADDDDDDDDDEDKADEEDAGEEEPTAIDELSENDTVVVAQYDDMVPVSGTVRLKKPFVVKTDITHDSKTLTNLGVGTIVDLKGTKSNWMLIDWPSGPAEMSPGWIELPRKEDTRVETVNANAARVEKDKQAEKIKKKEEEKAKKDPDKAKKGRPKIILKIEDTGTKTKK